MKDTGEELIIYFRTPLSEPGARKYLLSSFICEVGNIGNFFFVIVLSVCPTASGHRVSDLHNRSENIHNCRRCKLTFVLVGKKSTILGRGQIYRQTW